MIDWKIKNDTLRGNETVLFISKKYYAFVTLARNHTISQNFIYRNIFSINNMVHFLLSVPPPKLSFFSSDVSIFVKIFTFLSNLKNTLISQEIN